jgi:hypothetical protein
MNLPTSVDAGLAGTAPHRGMLPIALLAGGTILVAAGVVLTLRRRATA